MKRKLIQNHPNLKAEWFYLVPILRFRFLLRQVRVFLRLNRPNLRLISAPRRGVLNWVLFPPAFLSHQRRNPHLGLPIQAWRLRILPGFSRVVSAIEMELSEDYTCVISHGPNPRTTHIFEDCIVESCCGGSGFSDSRKENGFFTDRLSSFPSESFLSICYSCKKNLGQGKDIYMYRGEKAFCSSECRYQQILLEEGMDKLEPDDDYGTCS